METKAKKTVKKTVEFNFKMIKSFEDACKKENVDPEKLPDVSMLPEGLRKAIINAYKLMIIFQAINNGWIADYTDWNQYKYYPWYEVKSSGSGFVLSDSGYDYTIAFTYVGSRLCTDTSEKSLYIAKQFKAEYQDYFF